MPPHHHRRGGFRGRRGFGGPNTIVVESPVVYEEAVMLDRPSDLDLIFVPPTDDPELKIPQAGMTFFEHDASGPDENQVRAGELDRNIIGLLRDVNAMPSGSPEWLALSQDLVNFQRNWQVWREAHTSWFSMVGAGDELDRFTVNYNVLRNRAIDVAAKTGGPSPTSAIVNPTPLTPWANDVTKVVTAVGIVAGILIFGPMLARSFSH